VTGQGADNFYQIKQQIDSSFYQLFSNQKLFLRNLLSENPGSMASLLLLNQRFANKILLDEAENFDLFVKIDSNLFAKYPANTHVAKHHERVLKITRQKAEQAKSEALLAPGNPAPVLNLRAVSGQTVSLASFKGKMVLLNFWASWSPPSRAANIQLMEVYQKYHSMGFEIFGVSFDTNPDIWKKSVEIDKLQWPNVSDLAGINSPVRKLYNLPENLPYFYLVDKDGKILAKGFTVAQLKAILKEKLD
jgi:peroxiredoxin